MSYIFPYILCKTRTKHTKPRRVQYTSYLPVSSEQDSVCQYEIIPDDIAPGDLWGTLTPTEPFPPGFPGCFQLPRATSAPFPGTCTPVMAAHSPSHIAQDSTCLCASTGPPWLSQRGRGAMSLEGQTALPVKAPMSGRMSQKPYGLRLLLTAGSFMGLPHPGTGARKFSLAICWTLPVLLQVSCTSQAAQGPQHVYAPCGL